LQTKKIKIFNSECYQRTRTKVDILHTSVITNDSPGLMTEKFSNTVKRTQTFQLSRSNSITQSLKTFRHFSIKEYIGFSLLNIFDVSGDAGTDFGEDWRIDGTKTNGNVANNPKK
jgi:hypothetical protein